MVWCGSDLVKTPEILCLRETKLIFNKTLNINLVSLKCSYYSLKFEEYSYEFLKKEVFQPHLPVRLPCYDFTPVTSSALGAPLLKGWGSDFGHSQLPWCDGRCVQGPGTYSPPYGWPAITSDSDFMQASCSLQSELRPGFWGWLALAGLQLFVPAIVARV